MTRFARTLVFVAVLATATNGFAPLARAVPQASGPSVTADRTTVVNGVPVKLQIAGFQSSFVTISVCGNEARRGSGDCNLLGSQGLRLDADGGSRAVLYIVEPPVPCPCVIRVANQTNDEIAIAPITLTDHPTAAVVDPPIPADAVRLAVVVRAEPSGVIDTVRALMGGEARYRVTVKATNRTTVPLRKVALFGAVGRHADDELVAMDIPNPDLILPGQTWTEDVFVRVPSPTFGSFTFRVSATGAGPVVVSVATTKHRTPVLLALLIVVLLMIVVVMYRWLTRRRLRKASALGDTVGDDDSTVEERVPHYTS